MKIANECWTPHHTTVLPQKLLQATAPAGGSKPFVWPSTQLAKGSSLEAAGRETMQASWLVRLAVDMLSSQ